MPGPAYLPGEEVALHTVEEGDLPFLQRHRNDPAIRTGLTTAAPQNGYEAERAHERHTEDDSGVGLLVVPREADDGGPTAGDGAPSDGAEDSSAAPDGSSKARDGGPAGEEGSSTPAPVGMVVLFDVDESNGTGELAAWITPAEQGNGYATAGTRLMLRHAFGERRLHKVVARALVSNDPSRATLEKLGLTEEGVQRDEKWVDGEYHDVVRYSMLAREWGGA